MKLVRTQALHWLAFLAAMWLMFLPEVRGVVNDNATSLTLLILLALGTFVAGVMPGSGASAQWACSWQSRCRRWRGSRNPPCCFWSASQGVFGVPTFVFDNELFWGGDRIGLLRERLDEKGVPRRPVCV